MGPIQSALMSPGKTDVSQLVSPNRQSHIYELNFASNGVTQRAIVKVFDHSYQSIIFVEVWNLWRVERLLGWALDPRTGTHYIVMKKEGYFFNEPSCVQLGEKTKKKLISQARWKYITKHRMYIG